MHVLKAAVIQGIIVIFLGLMAGAAAAATKPPAPGQLFQWADAVITGDIVSWRKISGFWRWNVVFHGEVRVLTRFKGGALTPDRLLVRLPVYPGTTGSFVKPPGTGPHVLFLKRGAEGGPFELIEPMVHAIQLPAENLLAELERLRE